jgi:hypothetical protein
MYIKREIDKIFKINRETKNISPPPDQVFKDQNFNFLLTKGGNLANDSFEYKKLMDALESLGEKEFFVVKNIGINDKDYKSNFIIKMPIESNFDSFQKMTQNFDRDFGLILEDFLVFGNNTCWGIYICEYPSINIIGCNKEYSDIFREVFGIKGNGYRALEEFISKEFATNPKLKKQFSENYNC